MNDTFNERFSAVRNRFAAKLDGRIGELDAALPRLSGDDASALEVLAIAHRRAHDPCGLSPTVGFVATGRAARAVEQILRAPLRAHRGLNEEELGALRHELAQLRVAAGEDFKSRDHVGA